jgi:MFS family permease
MIATDVARGVLHGMLAVLILTGAVRIWHIVVIEAAFGAAQAFFQPAYTGLIPQTVPESRIQDAKALSETTANLAFLIGPLIATALVLGVGAGEAFALDAATFALSAILLLRVHPRQRGEAVDVSASGSVSLVRDLREGWREVRSRTWVWVTILVFTGAVMCVYAQWYALAPSIARHVYGDAGVFGMLEGVAGAGAVIGAIVGLRWQPRRPLMVGMLLVMAWPIQDGLFALGAPVAIVAVAAFGTGVGFSLLMVFWETALARHIPPRLLGRVSAWDWMGSLALLPLGFLVAGPLAGAFGARTVLGVGCVIGLVLLGLALLSRSVRELPGEPAAASPAASASASASAEGLLGDVGVEAGGEPEVAHVDALVGVVHERPGLEQVHEPLREEPVRGALRKRITKPARIREAREDHRDRLGT